MGKGLVMDTPIAIFLAAGLYFLFTGKDQNTQLLGLVLTAIGLFFMWGRK